MPMMLPPFTKCSIGGRGERCAWWKKKGQTTAVSYKLDVAYRDALNEYADKHGLTKSAALELAIEYLLGGAK